MKLHVFSAAGATIEEHVDEVVAAENDGFDGFWFGHIFNADALTVIAAAGAKTKRIELGTTVVPIYIHHPFGLAQQAISVQAMIGTRLALGIGLSHQPVVEGMWGLSYAQPARYMREYLSVVRALVNDGRVSFQGETFRVAGGIQVNDAKPFPILLAALAPAMLRTAGELADGTVTWVTGPKTIETHVAPRISKAAADAGRPAPRICAALPICVTDDAAAARESAGHLFQIYGQLQNYKRMLDKEGVSGPADVAIVGGEAEVERQIRRLGSAGATDFLAAAFPVGGDAKASLARTRALLKELIGKV